MFVVDGLLVSDDCLLHVMMFVSLVAMFYWLHWFDFLFVCVVFPTSCFIVLVWLMVTFLDADLIGRYVLLAGVCFSVVWVVCWLFTMCWWFACCFVG